MWDKLPSFRSIILPLTSNPCGNGMLKQSILLMFTLNMTALVCPAEASSDSHHALTYSYFPLMRQTRHLLSHRALFSFQLPGDHLFLCISKPKGFSSFTFGEWGGWMFTHQLCHLLPLDWVGFFVVSSLTLRFLLFFPTCCGLFSSRLAASFVLAIRTSPVTAPGRS